MPLFYGVLTVLSASIMVNFKRDKSLLFHIILGILMSVLIYYMNFIFNSLGNNDSAYCRINIFPILIISLISIMGLVRLMKNSFILVFFVIFLNVVSFAETFRFETSNLEIIDNGKLITAGKGKVFSSNDNLEIKAEKFEYNKDLDILKTFKNGSVLIEKEGIKIEFDNSIINQNQP